MKTRGMTRRQALGAAGTAGAGALVVGGMTGVPGFGKSSVDPVTADPAEAATCVLTPSMTEGPYFVDEKLDRSDIRASQDGVKLTITANVFSADANCDAFTGCVVDMWQCNAQGAYSDESAAGNGNTVGQTYLRGYQTTDSKGQVTFTTIYPGWYSGRTIHIHMKFRVFDGTKTTYEFNTQLFFNESVTATVLGQSEYQRSGTRSTTNSNDGIYDADMLVPLTGSVANGYAGTVDIGLSGMPDEATATTPDGTDTQDTSVSASVTKVSVTSKAGGKRVVLATVKNTEKASADARVVRNGELLARKRTGSMAAGSKTVRLPIAHSAKAGKALLRVVFTDSSSNTKVVRRMVQVPGRKS